MEFFLHRKTVSLCLEFYLAITLDEGFFRLKSCFRFVLLVDYVKIYFLHLSSIAWEVKQKGHLI